jgi:acyl carrier protein
VGADLYAEVALEQAQAGQAHSFAVHPALLDAAVHATFLETLDGGQGDAVGVPFSFAGVRLHGPHAGVLRVRLGAGEETASLLALDGEGRPVLAVQRLQTRAIDQDRLKAAAARVSHDSLYELQWVPLPSAVANGSPLHAGLLGGGEDLQVRGLELERHADLQTLERALESAPVTPELVLVRAAALAPEGELRESVHLLSARVLELLQAWIASAPLVQARLVLLTEGALAAAEGDVPDLRQAALVGLLRSAQSEHPGRFGLIDLDGTETSADALHDALASEEPELALRDGSLYAPRFGRLAAGAQSSDRASVDTEGTVLITGGTGGLGALLAAHLAASGVRRLLLASRSGRQAEGAGALQDQLGELGCEAQIVACDISQKAQLEALLASISAEHPLSMVLHTAGVLDDGVIESLDRDRLARVMAPKVDAAINLHESIGQAELILFSSAAAAVGSPGQGNYAAANAFLDALACSRHAQGLPGMSLAWGAWARASGMAGSLGEADRVSFERQGVLPLSDERGLELFDIARGIDSPLLLPVHLNTATLSAQARAGMLPAVLRGLIRSSARGSSEAEGSLAVKLARAPESEWDAIVAELVKGHVAGVLGHASPAAVDPQRPFKEAGFDSLAAVELRNRLSKATGLKLPSTLVFDHPTPAAVAGLIRVNAGRDGASRPVIEVQLDEMEAMLSSIAGDQDARRRVEERLRLLGARIGSFLAAPAGTDFAQEHRSGAEDLESVSDDELFEIIEKEFGG